MYIKLLILIVVLTTITTASAAAPSPTPSPTPRIAFPLRYFTNQTVEEESYGKVLFLHWDPKIKTTSVSFSNEGDQNYTQVVIVSDYMGKLIACTIVKCKKTTCTPVGEIPMQEAHNIFKVVIETIPTTKGEKIDDQKLKKLSNLLKEAVATFKASQ